MKKLIIEEYTGWVHNEKKSNLNVCGVHAKLKKMKCSVQNSVSKQQTTNWLHFFFITL